MKRESLVAASDIVRTRARLTKIRPRPSWNLPHSVADEFLECGRLFEEAHRRDVKRAALAYDGFVRGELIDTAPDIKRSYEKLLDDVKRNRLCIGSIDSDTLLAGKPKAPGPKSGAHFRASKQLSTMLTIALRLRTLPCRQFSLSTSPFKVFAEEAYAAGNRWGQWPDSSRCCWYAEPRTILRAHG